MEIKSNTNQSFQYSFKRPSTLPTPTPKRKSPPSRTCQNDELNVKKKTI